MSRSVTVKLEADVAAYIARVAAAAEATEKFDDKVKKTDEDLDKVPAASARAAAAMRALGLEAGKTRLALEDTGSGPTNVLELLDKKLEETRANVKKFAEEFNRTGSLDSFNLWKQATKDLGDLERFKKQFAGVLKEAEKVAIPSGEESGKSFTGRFVGVFGKGAEGMLAGLAKLPWAGAIFKPISEAMSALPPQAQAAIGLGIAAAITASATFIGAAFSGALLGGVGTAGIGLAIVGQLHDPAVMAAAGQLKDQLLSSLAVGTSAFGPLLAAGAGTISDALLRSGPALAKALQPLQAIVPLLARGIGEFVERLIPALGVAFHAAAPVLRQFAADLPNIASAIGIFFRELDFGSQGATKGLHDLISLINGLVILTGGLLGGLSKMYEIIRSISTYIATGDLFDLVAVFVGMPPAIDPATDSVKTFAQTQKDLAQRTDDARRAVDDYITSLDKLFGINMNADQAAIAAAQSIDDLTASIVKNGNQWDINTQQGRDNTSALETAIQKQHDKMDADIAAGKNAVQAAQDYNAQVDALLGIASRAGDAKSALDALKGKYEVDIHEVYTQYFIAGANPNGVDFHHGLATGGMRRAAVGMYIPPRDPGTVLVGEPQTGGEMLTPLRGISQAAAMMQTRVIGDAYGFDVMPRHAGGGSVGGTFRHEFVFSGAAGGSLGSVIMGMVRTGEIQLKTSQLVSG